jgi:hypothetical protein
MATLKQKKLCLISLIACCLGYSGIIYGDDKNLNLRVYNNTSHYNVNVKMVGKNNTDGNMCSIVMPTTDSGLPIHPGKNKALYTWYRINSDKCSGQQSRVKISVDYHHKFFKHKPKFFKHSKHKTKTLHGFIELSCTNNRHCSLVNTGGYLKDATKYKLSYSGGMVNMYLNKIN